MLDRLCISLNSPGAGGVAGGGGFAGQSSLSALGFSATSYGLPVIRTTTGMLKQFLIQLTKDIQGTIPSNLDDISRILFVCLDLTNPGVALFKVPCLIKFDGCVSILLSPKQVNNNTGIHKVLLNCFDLLDNITKVFNCILLILKGFYGCSNARDNLTIRLVRMAVYDTCAQANVLLDDLLFSDSQIVYCMHRAIDDWNDVPPSLYDRMTINNFPYKSRLLLGVLAHLFTMAAYRYIRNQMRHSNAGLTFDDQDKGQIYMQIGQANKQQWDQWISNKKSLLNMQLCMGTISDAYHLSDIDLWWY